MPGTSKKQRNALAAKKWRAKNKLKIQVRQFFHNLRRRIAYQTDQYGHPMEPQQMYKNPYRKAQALGYRSGLEVRITKELDAQNIPYQYEEHSIKFTRPAEECTYTPDLLLANGIVVEIKGEFDTADRKKHKIIKAAHPDIDIRIMFGNANQRISKRSQTTYAKWCEAQGIPYAHKSIPASWTTEPVNAKSLAALKKACRDS